MSAWEVMYHLDDGQDFGERAFARALRLGPRDAGLKDRIEEEEGPGRRGRAANKRGYVAFINGVKDGQAIDDSLKRTSGSIK